METQNTVKLLLQVHISQNGENQTQKVVKVLVRNGLFSLLEVMNELQNLNVIKNSETIDIDYSIFKKFGLKLPILKDELVTINRKSEQNIFKINIAYQQQLLSQNNQIHLNSLKNFSFIPNTAVKSQQSDKENQQRPQKRKRAHQNRGKESEEENQSEGSEQKMNQEIKKGQRVNLKLISKIVEDFNLLKEKNMGNNKVTRIQFCNKNKIKSPTLYHYNTELKKKGIS